MLYRCIAPITEGNLGVAKELSKEVQLRHIESNDLEMIVIDGRHLFWSQSTSLQVQNQGGLGMLYSNERNYVEGMKALMERLWEGGVEAEVRIREVEVGRAIESFKVVSGFVNVENCLCEMIARAKTDLLITLGGGSIPFLSELDKKLNLAELKGRGVRVRCMFPINKQSLNCVRDLSERIRFRHVDEAPLCAVVTESEVAFHFLVSYTESLQSMLWSNDKKIVSEIAGMVEVEWGKGLDAEARIRTLGGPADQNKQRSTH